MPGVNTKPLLTGEVNTAPPFCPPYYHREYRNDISPTGEKPDNIYKRVALVALPVLSLYKPLIVPISMVMDATRLYTSIFELEGISAYINTTIVVISLASTLFHAPVGMIITTSKNIIFELSHLKQSLQEKDWEASLQSLVKIINNAFYLALVCRGGLELSIVSFAMQALTHIISSRCEFKEDNQLEAYGNLLMAAIRIFQGCSQFQLLQRQWKIEEAVKQIFVGELHEKWRFPSDHLPIGAEVDGIKIISWNVLNNAFMQWVTTNDSQGLDRSLISELDKAVQPNGLTERDLFIVSKVVNSMTASGHIIALQECGTPFLQALQESLPPHWQMVKSFEGYRKDQDVILFDKSKLTYRPDQSEVTTDSYPSVPRRPIQNALFSITGETRGPNLRVVNTHIPGDPALPAREEFAKYVRRTHSDNQTTVALGDNNFERHEMISAYKKNGFFKVQSAFTMEDQYRSLRKVFKSH